MQTIETFRQPFFLPDSLSHLFIHPSAFPRFLVPPPSLRSLPSSLCSPLPCPQGNALELEHLSELTEEEYEAQIYQRRDLKGFMWLDAKYLNPFFTRRLTQEVTAISTASV